MSVYSVNNQKSIEDIIKESSEKGTKRKTGELGKDDFLNLLVTQLRYQDPLNPMDDKEFIGQMAQFSALEQMQNMNSSFAAVKAFNLIGKQISANIADSVTGELKTVQGDVTNVKLSGSRAFVVVNGEDVPVESITDVQESYTLSPVMNMSSYTGLIGCKVSGAVYDAASTAIAAVKGTVRSIHKGMYENYAMLDGVNVEISQFEDRLEGYASFKDLLDSSVNNGETIIVAVVNSSTGEKVPVSARVKSYSIEDGNIRAVLDGVYIPLDSISSVTSADKDISIEEGLLRQILDSINKITGEPEENIEGVV